MSIIRTVAAIFAALFLCAAFPAAAKEVDAAAINRCMYEWAETYAREYGVTVDEALRYARGIQIDPPTTLPINGAPRVFDASMAGATVWSVCALSLQEEVWRAERARTASAASTQTVAAPLSEPQQEGVRQDSDQAPWIWLIVLAFVTGVTLGWSVSRIIMRRRDPIQIGMRGHQTPRASPDPDPGLDDPDDQTQPVVTPAPRSRSRRSPPP